MKLPFCLFDLNVLLLYLIPSGQFTFENASISPFSLTPPSSFLPWKRQFFLKLFCLSIFTYFLHQGTVQSSEEPRLTPVYLHVVLYVILTLDFVG